MAPLLAECHCCFVGAGALDQQGIKGEVCAGRLTARAGGSYGKGYSVDGEAIRIRSSRSCEG